MSRFGKVVFDDMFDFPECHQKTLRVVQPIRELSYLAIHATCKRFSHSGKARCGTTNRGRRTSRQCRSVRNVEGTCTPRPPLRSKSRSGYPATSRCGPRAQVRPDSNRRHGRRRAIRHATATLGTCHCHRGRYRRDVTGTEATCTFIAKDWRSHLTSYHASRLLPGVRGCLSASTALTCKSCSHESFPISSLTLPSTYRLLTLE